MEAFEQDPRFRKLSYAEQTAVRAGISLNRAKQDPRFAALPLQEQRAVQQGISASAARVAPALYSWQGELSDQDRMGGAAGPDASYKSALLLGERIDAGDATALRDAKNWIIGNRVATESIVARAALGAKDAIEVLFGRDEELFNDLSFHTQDYQKLASWLTAKMPAAQALSVEGASDTVGLATGFVETALLNAIGVGTLAAPGLFTKKLFTAAQVAQKAAVTKSATWAAARGMPVAVEAVSSGVVDVIRKLPQLIETQQISGNAKLFGGIAATFGEGVAFDFAFSAARDLWKFMLAPTAKALKGFKLTDAEGLAPFLDAAKHFREDTFSKYLSDVFGGRMPKELLDQLDPESAGKVQALAQRLKTLSEVDSFEPRTPGGFAAFAKAAGYDADLRPDGGIDVFEDVTRAKKLESFATPSEALSWMIAKGPEGAPDISGGAIGRLRTYTTTKLTVDQLTDKQLTTLMTPVLNGKVPVENIAATTKEVLRRGNVKTSLKIGVLPEAEYQALYSAGPKAFPAGVVHMPDAITSQVTENTYWSRMDEYLKGSGATTPGWAELHMYDRNLSYPALKATVEQLGPGASFEQLGDKYVLKTAQGTQTYSELTEANRAITKALVDTGVLSEADIITQVAHSTGYVLTKDIDPQGVVPHRWVLRDQAAGREVDQSDDLNKILFGTLEFSPRLPEALAPDMLVTGSKIVISKNVAYGPVSSLRGMLDDYGPAEDMFRAADGSKKTLEKIFPDGSVLTYDSGPEHYALEVPSIALRRTFKNTKQAKDYMDGLAGSYGVVEQLAAEKGFLPRSLPDGSLGFWNGETLLRARSAAEAQTILRQSPDPVAHAELVSFIDPPVEEAIRTRTKEVLQSASQDLYDPKDALKLTQTSLKANFNSFWKPAMSSFEELSKIYGKPEIVERGRQLFLRKRYVGQQTYQAVETLKRVLSDEKGKLLSKHDLSLMGKLLQYDESIWDGAAKKLMASEEYVLPERVKVGLRQSREYLQHMGEYFGVDSLRFLQQYSPHIKDVLDAEGGLASMLSRLSPEQAMERVFGARWNDIPEVKFLSENARLDAFLQANSQSNIMNVLMWYTEHGLKQKYLGQHLNDLKGWLVQLKKDGANGPLLERLGSFYKAISGGDTDYLGSVITDASIKASQSIAMNLRKLGAVFPKGSAIAKKFDEIAESTTTTNYLDQLSSTMSYATLGFRPFRAMANMAQFMNTHAVFGHFAEDAVAAVDAEGDAYVRKLFSKGILNERIFAASAGDLGSKVQSFLDKSLAWQQNSEYLTRAWTAKTVELAFNAAQDKLARGLLGQGDTAFASFMRLANLDVLADTDQATVLQLMRSGKPEAARDLAQASAVRILMFDYSKENYPMAFKGTVGRLFGKFGVYPVGQVDLMRRIVSSGDPATRMVRGLRLMATSLAVYEGFRQAGIDYSGFLAFDAFSFGGGPLYQTGQDLLKSRDDGPEGAMARRSLARNWSPVADGKLNVPRLLVPGSLQLNALGEAAQSVSQGNYYEAFLDALSAPRDASWIGPGNWYAP